MEASVPRLSVPARSRARHLGATAVLARNLRRLCILTTPFFVGLAGFRSKL